MTLEKVTAILAEYKEMDASEITAESTFEELGLDSLDVVEIVMKIEDEFNITLEMNSEINTVGKLADFIDTLL